ncbi:predicted protein [Naegleria gruberi]|uniref:Predicted protein n=1 Tax=Naegleria gruberi TaxID=5762 RepID=D2V1V2_NAEGR|nr:uncharacterized protein NAEGRDRAFT_62706 [Naegleria gruberi]EFC49227.1 predicted protein [Naegleria gruberi]|eukprot:XP_002681971.1 predicted protein [Naegleria gruberi strain NEG-M]
MSSEGSSLLEGYFHKQGQGATGASYKRRWFKVYSDRIEYMVGPKDKKIKGDVKTLDMIRLEDGFHGPNQFKNYGLSLVTESRTYKICFEDVVTRQRFKEVVTKLIPSTVIHHEEKQDDDIDDDEDMPTFDDSSEEGFDDLEIDNFDKDNEEHEGKEDEGLMDDGDEELEVKSHIDIKTDDSRMIKNPLIPDYLVRETPFGSVNSDDSNNFSSGDESFMPSTKDDKKHLNQTPPSQELKIKEDWSDYSDYSDDETLQTSRQEEPTNSTEEEVIISSQIEIQSKLLFPEKDVDELLEDEEKTRRETKSSDHKQVSLLSEDNLNIGSYKHFIERMTEHGESEILWSGSVRKVVRGKVNKFDERSLVVTKSALYLLTAKSKGLEFKARVTFRDISSLLINAYETEEKDFLSILITNPAINNGHDMLLAFNDNREKFLAHIKNAFEQKMLKELIVHLVDDVTLYTRTNRAERKPIPQPISKEDIVTSTDHDYANFIVSADWRYLLKQYGDRHIYFSEEMLVNNTKHAILITNLALIKTTDAKVKRRIELVDISEIWIDNAAKENLLIKVPSEYDIFISTAKRNEAVSSLQEALEKLKVDFKLIQSVNIKEKGQLKKTGDYRQKMKKMKDPKRIKDLMTHAIKSKDVSELEKAICSARIYGLTNDKLYILCLQQIQKIKTSSMVQEEMEDAYKNCHLKKMRELLKKAESLRPHLTQLIHVMTPKYTELVNTRLFKKKMEEAISKKDFRMMKDIFSKALRAGLAGDVEKYKRDYDADVQKEYLRDLVSQHLANRDGDALRLILIDAKSLGVENEKIFQEAKNSVLLFKEETKIKRRLNKGVDDANDIGNIEKLRELIKDAKAFVSTNPSISLSNTIDFCNKECDRIQQRFSIIEKIDEAIMKRDKSAIDEIIESNKLDDRLDLTKAYECLDHINTDREQEQLAAIYKLEETLDSLIVLYDHETTPDNEIKLMQIIVEAEMFVELGDLVDSAKNLIQKKRMEAKRKERKILSIKYRLAQGIKERDIDDLETVLEEGPFYPELATEVQIAKEMLSELYLHTHVKENIVVVPALTEKVEKKENTSTGKFEAFLKSAHMSLGSVEKSVEVKLDFEELLEKKDIVALAKFINKNKQLLTKEEAQRATEVMEELSLPSATPATATESSKEELQKKTKPFSFNTMVSSLHSNIMNLLSTCDADSIDPTSGRYVVHLFPLGDIIVKNITSILYNGTRKIYWIKERTPYDIFKNLQVSAVQDVIREFEALDQVQHLPSDNFGKTASLLLVQYLLDCDFFVYAINQLAIDEMYLQECYDKTAILFNKQLKDEILGVFSLLNQFDFRFGFTKEVDAKDVASANIDPLASTQSGVSITQTAQPSLSLQLTSSTLDMISLSPLLQLKQSIKSIVQFFYMKKNDEKMDLYDIGDDSKSREIDVLIRKKLCYSLMDIFLKGFKSFSIFKTYHVWNVIEEAARLKKSSAVDIGGIGIPSAVETVNKIVEERLSLNTKQLSNIEDLKFRIFVCYSLNDNQLSYFIQSILRESDLINNYYEADSLIRNSNIREKVIGFLSKLDRLPFNLSLTSELL